MNTVVLQLTQYTGKTSGENDGSTLMYSLIGAGIGLFTWFSLLVGLEGHRQWRQRRRNINIELSENLASDV